MKNKKPHTIKSQIKIRIMQSHSMLKNSLAHSLFIFVFVISIVLFCTEENGLCSYNDEFAFIKANNYLSRGKFVEALGMYQEVAILSANINTRARALLFLGYTYVHFLNQYETSVNQFNNIIVKYPDTPAASDALLNKGMVLYDRGNYKKAHKTFIEYINNYPEGMRKQSAAIWADRSRALMNGARDHMPRLTPEDTMMRVLVRKNAGHVTFASKGKITVVDEKSGDTLYSGEKPVYFSKKGSFLTMNRRKIGTNSCIIKPHDSLLLLDGRRYRGFFKLAGARKGFNAVNIIQIEDYLYGVVPKEMPASWEKQALMAQSVAARTYALYVKGNRRLEPYDLDATTMSQVYGGYNSETPESNKAVDQTCGQIMTHNDELIIAYYHSNSGGHTEDPGNVWETDILCPRGIPDTYSARASRTDWNYFLSYRNAEKLLGKRGLKTGRIKRVQTSGKSRSGRALDVLITSNTGVSRLSGNNFRIKIGESKLKSTNFNMINHPDGILFKGKGYGHGVGMSQWGARRMAKEGSGYHDILKFYYQNIKIRDLFQGREKSKSSLVGM